jgi:DNA repair exonuclease SbcCD ATPase subunit
MADLLKPLQQMSSNDLRNQVAVMNVINLKNLSNLELKKASKNVIKGINFLGRMVGKSIKEPECLTIEELISLEIDKLYSLDQQALYDKLKNHLISKSNLSDPSDEALSIEIINEVSKKYDLSDYLTPGQKADIIVNRIEEELLKNLRKQLKKQNSAEAEKTIKVIEKSLDNLDKQEKEALKEALNIEELSGEILRNALLNMGKPAALIAAVQVSGFGAYIALTTIIHAVFTSMLSITLPFAFYTSATSFLALFTGPVGFLFVIGVGSFQFLLGKNKLNRALLAQIIFLAGKQMTEDFTPKDESLPYFSRSKSNIKENKIKQKEYIDLEKEIKSLKNQNSSLRSTISKSDEKLKANEIKIKESKSHIEKKSKELEELRRRKQSLDQELRKKKESLKKLKISNEETDSLEYELKSSIRILSMEVNDYEAKEKENEAYLDEISEELSNYEKENSKLKDRIHNLEQQNESKEKVIQEQEKILNKKEDSLKEYIEKSWTGYFPKFKIQKKAIRDVIKFDNESIINVERALITLHEADDPRAYSRGKMKGKNNYDHIGVSMNDGCPTRIYYDVVNDSNYPVIIREIAKHNKKWTQ